jgi:UDP-2-acetamido-3-amino-2,3-dideoxy-glucuronate N-acetyltransferase
MNEQKYFVHESSYVDQPCSIGPGTKIWHFCHIMKNSVIGANCNIGQNVVISPDVRIGNNVKIQNNVSVYTGCILEDDVFCGPSMVFTNVVNPRSHINRKDQYKTTLVRRGASLGANCTVVCGTTIGEYAFVGAGSVITRDIPDYTVVYGTPARVRGWICACGVRLDFRGECAETQCQACGSEYQKLGQVVAPGVA